MLYLRKFKEISKAVQLVAIAKLRKLQKVIESREYSLFLSLELFIDVNMYVFNNLRNTFVIITSDKSCCGKLNSDVLYASKDAMETYMEGNRVLKLISVG